MPNAVKIAAFYKFVPLTELALLRSQLQSRAKKNRIWGTILLAAEGINANIAGTSKDLDHFVTWLRRDDRFSDVAPTFTEAENIPFYRLKIRVREEIVTMGMTEINPAQVTGQHIAPESWNELIRDPGVVVFDTRNDYEVAMGTFKGSENPNTDAFREWPDYVKRRLGNDTTKKVAMFCTGGIRCEKASALLRQAGFDHVYQLQGGILNYLNRVPPDESLWEGDCFVFDERVALDHQLQPSEYELCRGCRHPLSQQDKQAPEFELGVSCPRCAGELTDRQREAFRERQRQVELAAERGYVHLGDVPVKRTSTTKR